MRFRNLITDLLTYCAVKCSQSEPLAQPEEYAKNPCSTDDNMQAQPYGQAYTNVCISATVFCTLLLLFCLRASRHVSLHVLSDSAPADR